MTWTRDLPARPGFYWIDHPEWPTLSVCLIVNTPDGKAAMVCGNGHHWNVEDFGICHPDVHWMGPVDTPKRQDVSACPLPR